jgi:hypothetical protein
MPAVHLVPVVHRVRGAGRARVVQLELAVHPATVARQDLGERLVRVARKVAAAGA